VAIRHSTFIVILNCDNITVSYSLQFRHPLLQRC
jgi:hypothetical protein